MQDLRVDVSATAVDTRILAVLAKGPTTTSALAQSLDLPREAVAARCQALRAAHAVRWGVVRARDLRLIETLRAEPQATSDAADILGVSPHQAYAACRRLERLGLLTSTLETSPQRLIFFPATGQVLSHSNHEHIESIVADLKAIARRVVHQHGVPRGGQLPKNVKVQLRREYRAYFSTLAARVSDASERTKIRAFEAQLMAVLQGTRLRDVLAMTGARLMHPKLRRWSVALLTLTLMQPGGLLPGEPVFTSFRRVGRPKPQQVGRRKQHASRRQPGRHPTVRH
jgi:predicted ArsR family transcriptional regulator